MAYLKKYFSLKINYGIYIKENGNYFILIILIDKWIIILKSVTKSLNSLYL